ncbi:MAG: hypothetical protein WAM44_04635, partial [Chthoniobacterales bacterium]
VGWQLCRFAATESSFGVDRRLPGPSYDVAVGQDFRVFGGVVFVEPIDLDTVGLFPGAAC